MNLDNGIEITKDKNNEGISGFINICSMCSDKENRLYVADNGNQKITILSEDGKYLGSFGRMGQGPGEFMASQGQGTINISIGNDGKIYVFDSSNKRISAFNKDGSFIEDKILPKIVMDTPTVNSEGDLFIVFNDGKYAIHHYDSNMNYVRSFSNVNSVLRSKYYDISRILKGLIDSRFLRKVILDNDHLVALSNFSFRVFHYDEKAVLLKNFKINDNTFIEDFNGRNKTMKSKNSILAPFDLLTDKKENLFLLYFNGSINNWEIYNYGINGKFKNIIRMVEKVSIPIFIDDSGSLFASNKGTAILKYKIR